RGRGWRRRRHLNSPPHPLTSFAPSPPFREEREVSASERGEVGHRPRFYCSATSEPVWPRNDCDCPARPLACAPCPPHNVRREGPRARMTRGNSAPWGNVSMAYKILILGASYGSLLATKLLFAGHKVKLVCLPN